MIKKFLFSSQFYIYSAYLPLAFSLFTLPFITPYLSLRDYGIYGLLFSIYSFVGLVFNLGFIVEYQNTYFNNTEGYKIKWSEILGFQISWNTITAIPFILILFIFSYYQMGLWESIVSIALLIMPYLIFDPIKTVASRHLQYTNQHKRLFLITTGATTIQYTMVVIMVISFQLGFIAWFVGNFLNALFSFLFFYLYLKNIGVSINLNMSLPGLRHRIKTQTVIILHNLSGYLMETSDRILLALFKVPIDHIGAYNIACNYTNYGQTVNNALNTVFSPIYFKSIKGSGEALSHEQLQKLFKFWINLVFFMAVNMVIWSEYLFDFLYRNETLNTAYIYSFPMIVALLYKPFYVMVAANLIIQDKPKYIAVMSISGAVINIVLNIIFIPYFGIKATIYTTAIAYLFLGFSGLLFSKIRKELTHVYIHNYVFLLIIICICLAMVYFVDFSPLYVKIFTFVFSLFLLAVYNRRQIRLYLKGRFY